ncbi:MAG: hypothetical protein IJN04_05860 [Clostridia bacterium]|nr:hypothetical protein [Clostridia bacterium]
MKRMKRLTREQKILLSELGFDPDEWMLMGDHPDKIVVAKRDGRTMTVVYKRGRERK